MARLKYKKIPGFIQGTELQQCAWAEVVERDATNYLGAMNWQVSQWRLLKLSDSWFLKKNKKKKGQTNHDTIKLQ